MFSIDMEMEWKSAGAEMADQIEFNTEQIARSKSEHEELTSKFSNIEERMGYIEQRITQQGQTFESKHEKISSEVGSIKGRVDRVEEQVAQHGRDLSIQKSEHAKMTGEMSAMKRKVEQIDKTVAQHGSALAWLKQQNIKCRFEFTSKTSEDGSSRHRCSITYTKGGHPERADSEYYSTETEAEEQAARKIRHLQSLEVTVSRTDPETLKTPNVVQLEEYLKQHKLGGKVQYKPKSCKGGYQSTVFVPRRGPFHGGVCRSRERANDDAACQALQEMADKL